MPQKNNTLNYYWLCISLGLNVIIIHFLEEMILYKRREGRTQMQRKPRENGKPLKERVVETSKAIFIDIKFIHTFILCIYLQH